MKIAVVGVGAVGGYFGGKLAASGEDVTFITRSDSLRALKKRGLRVTSPNGDVHLPSIQVTDDPAGPGKVDVVLMAVKTWQLAGAARSIRPLVGPDTVIIPLQNGVEAEDDLSEIFGKDHVLGAICRILAAKTAPGRIRHFGVDPTIAVGELDLEQSKRVNRLVSLFRSAGIASEAPENIHVLIWKKFLFVTPTSGICALTRSSIGAVRTLPETRAMMESAMREILLLAGHKGVPLTSAAIQGTLEFLDGMPYEATSSMQRDVMEGRPSELEAHNGAVVRIGETAGIETPVNGFVYAGLLPLERLAREAAARNGAG